MIPTYNESGNIERLIYEILDLNIFGLNILVVDDNSPDGTGQIVEEISKRDRRVKLLLRMRDRGRGSAGRDGFLYCLKSGADVIIEMDADFSHDPRYIPVLIDGLRDSDMVLGSRMVNGGADIGRSSFRRAITKLANFYIRTVLGIKIKDCNSGFRCFKKEVLTAIDVGRIESSGSNIVQEVLFKAYLKGFKIKEIPIIFTERKIGKSKITITQLLKNYFMILKLKFLYLINKL